MNVHPNRLRSFSLIRLARKMLGNCGDRLVRCTTVLIDDLLGGLPQLVRGGYIGQASPNELSQFGFVLDPYCGLRLDQPIGDL